MARLKGLRKRKLGLIVQKFGGTSVADVERMRNVARLVIAEADRGNSVVTVVSAMGVMTDDLVNMIAEITDDPPAREMDMLLSTGEQISIATLAITLHAMGREAISLTGPQVGIETDSAHGKARILKIADTRVREALAAGKIVVVAGFQGTSRNMEITTLGRGGSDTTAVALAAALKADRCDIYTDVDGVFTADPRILPEARRLDAITYDEMLELASKGAKVLNSRAVELAKNFSVPLRVLNSMNPGPGTMVVKEYKHMEDFVVSGVTVNEHEAQISIIGVPDKPGTAAKVFKTLGDADIAVDMIIQNIGSDKVNDISFTVSEADFKRAKEIAEQLVAEMGALEVQTDDSIAKLSVVGVGMKSHSGVAGNMFQALADAGINIQMVSTSEICITCLIDVGEVRDALKALHKEFGLGKAAQSVSN